ncbi:phage tail protein, partial [Enterococcus faecalis]
MTALRGKQEISVTYAQGATTLLNRSIQGELSKTQSVELNLYFDEDILYINTAELTFKATAKGSSHSVTNIDLVVDGKKSPQLSL